MNVSQRDPYDDMPDIIGGDSLDTPGGYDLEVVPFTHRCDYCGRGSYFAGRCVHCRVDEADRREWRR